MLHSKSEINLILIEYTGTFMGNKVSVALKFTEILDFSKVF